MRIKVWTGVGFTQREVLGHLINEALTEPAPEQPTYGAKCLSGEPKFEIKHKSRCLQKIKLVNWGGKHVDWGVWPPLSAGSGP